MKYGRGARLLHRIALGSRMIGQTCFDIQNAANSGRRDPEADSRHVFIAGLARSGTTILTQELYNSGQLCSLTYRDMPFVLMPGLWRRLTGAAREDTELSERAHGDSVLVSYDSPEAFEEVFWRIFCSDEYIKPDRLVAHTVQAATLQQFASFVSNVLLSEPRSSCSRYLSKNNNNILRLGAIHRAFPKADILIPFRDPLQQASSLWKQHQGFLSSHDADPFSLAYMDWLGHHEFGRHHKPFSFNSGPKFDQFEAGNLNYWLALWADSYQHILSSAPEKSIFLDYDALCKPQSGLFQALLDHLELECAPETGFTAAQSHPSTSGVDAPLLEHCRTLHERLKKRCSLVNGPVHA